MMLVVVPLVIWGGGGEDYLDDVYGSDPHIFSLSLMLLSVSFHQEGRKNFHQGRHMPS